MPVNWEKTNVTNEPTSVTGYYYIRALASGGTRTTAPVGTVSLLTQTTSGIEPAFLLEYKRRKKISPTNEEKVADFTDALGDHWQEYTVYHHNFKKWMDVTGESDPTKSPYHGATSADVNWRASVTLQAVAQKYVEHSISKTCNIPNDATKELVSEVYMRAWESGCKGFTVYRDGCRTGVIVSNKEPEGAIVTTRAPKRSESLPCDIHHVQIKGEKWVICVGLLQGRPYEVFGGLADKVELPRKYKIGIVTKARKSNKDGSGCYSLVLGEADDTLVINNIVDRFDNPTYGAFTRSISLSLRHGVPTQFVVEQLLRDKHSDITSFNTILARVLKKYIIDGTAASAEKACPQCGMAPLVYMEGCATCKACGWSKC